MKNVKGNKQNKITKDLPPDTLGIIFDYLDSETFKSILKVNKLWYSIGLKSTNTFEVYHKNLDFGMDKTYTCVYKNTFYILKIDSNTYRTAQITKIKGKKIQQQKFKFTEEKCLTIHCPSVHFELNDEEKVQCNVYFEKNQSPTSPQKQSFSNIIEHNVQKAISNIDTTISFIKNPKSFYTFDYTYFAIIDKGEEFEKKYLIGNSDEIKIIKALKNGNTVYEYDKNNLEFVKIPIKEKEVKIYLPRSMNDEKKREKRNCFIFQINKEVHVLKTFKNCFKVCKCLGDYNSKEILDYINRLEYLK